MRASVRLKMCKIHILVDESEFSCPKESVNFDDESGGENGSCQRNQSPESGAPRRLWFERNANRISQQSITRVKLESARTRQVQQINPIFIIMTRFCLYLFGYPPRRIVCSVVTDCAASTCSSTSLWLMAVDFASSRPSCRSGLGLGVGLC